MKLNQKIKQLRLEKNYTQLYIAELLGIDATNYGRMERGEVNITAGRLQKIAEILDVDISVLLHTAHHFPTPEKEDLHSLLLQEILKEITIIRKKLIN